MKYLICAFLFLFSSCSEDEYPDYNNIEKNKYFLSLVESSTIISDTTKELVAHCSLLYPDEFVNDGTMWVPYYCDESQPHENPFATSTYPVLSKFNVSNPQMVSRFPIARANTRTSNNIFIGDRPPYDPNVIVRKDDILVYFLAYINNNTTLVSKIFDKNNLCINNELSLLKLRYKVNNENISVTLNDAGVMQCSKDIGYPLTSVSHIVFTRILKYENFYYVALGALFGDFKGFILRSSDGIVWDVVTVQPSGISVLEAHLEIIDNKVYYIARPNDDKKCYIGVYDLENNIWVNFKPIEGSMASRPDIFYYKNRLYVIYNLDKGINSGWGVVPRTCVTIQEVEPNTLNLNEKVTIQYKYGMHYFSVNKYNNKLYMTFTEDRRMINRHASDIAFTLLDF